MLDLLFIRTQLEDALKQPLLDANCQLILNDADMETWGKPRLKAQVLIGLSSSTGTPPPNQGSLSRGGTFGQTLNVSLDILVLSHTLWDEPSAAYALLKLISDIIIGYKFREDWGPVVFNAITPIGRDPKSRLWEYSMTVSFTCVKATQYDEGAW